MITLEEVFTAFGSIVTSGGGGPTLVPIALNPNSCKRGFSVRLRSESFPMFFAAVIIMLVAQCIGMESTQEPAHTIGIGLKGAAIDTPDCASSSISFHSQKPIESPSLSASSNVAHYSQAMTSFQINMTHTSSRSTSPVRGEAAICTPHPKAFQTLRYPPRIISSLQCPFPKNPTRRKYRDQINVQFVRKKFQERPVSMDLITIACNAWRERLDVLYAHQENFKKKI
ncbi:hypothetical protein H4Q26_003839 [Puccinia striiformis f. sp. tritici PST-130]|nr:hypothetical protein H4Q26_003839 [Puccinia striiformis f. sp. tritici PST-130]